jgi:phosphate/sulfate permease
MNSEEIAGSIFEWIISIGVIGTIVAMLYFLWINFHESQYKDLIDKSQVEKPKNKVATAIIFILIIWAIGFLLFSQ